MTFISVLNALLSITALLGSVLILVALRRESSPHPPSKLLLRDLATTDLCVGLIVELLYIALSVTVVNEVWNICGYVAVAVAITSHILFAVSLHTLTAISVDILLALLLGLRYKQLVTLKRVYMITITFCVVSTVSSPMRLFLKSTVSSKLGLFLHGDFLHSPSSSKSSAGPCSTTEPNKSTEHSAIQKGGVQCHI